MSGQKFAGIGSGVGQKRVKRGSETPHVFNQLETLRGWDLTDNEGDVVLSYSQYFRNFSQMGADRTHSDAV